MSKFAVLFILIMFLTLSPFLSFSIAQDPYAFSTLILTKAINTNGFVSFQAFHMGDHWRGHAQNMLGDIRPLTSIIIAILSQVTMIDPLTIASIPLFVLLIPVIVFLFIRQSLLLNHGYLSSYVLILFFITSILLLQPGGINYLSFGFFLTLLMLYTGVRWLKQGSSIDAIVTIVIFIAASKTYYTAYMSTALFLIGMLLYTIIFLREKRRYWSFTLVSVVFLFIVLWCDNIIQATLTTISFEKINMAINSIMLFKPAVLPISNPYVEITPTNPYLTISHFIIRVSVGVIGACAFFVSLKNRTFRRYMPIVTGLLFMSLFETFSYILVGGVFLVRLLYSLCLPFVIVLWVGNLKITAISQKIYVLILVILCILSGVIVLRNYGYNIDRQMIVKNAQLIDSVTDNVNSFFKNDTSYVLIAGSTESAFLSYKTFEPDYYALAEFGPFLPILDGNLSGFTAEINNLSQHVKLLFMPYNYPFLEVYAWGDIYLLKTTFYDALASTLNVIYAGPFIIYEIS